MVIRDSFRAVVQWLRRRTVVRSTTAIRVRVVGRLGKILTRWSDEENEHLAQYITQQGYECMATKGSGVRFSRTSTKELIDVLRPHTHRCMRSKFVKTTSASLGLKSLEEELRQRHHPVRSPGFCSFNGLATDPPCTRPVWGGA